MIERKYNRQYMGYYSSVMDIILWYRLHVLLLKLGIGTPHNGSSLASLGKVISNVLAAFSPLHPARALITTLQQDSKVLFEITQDFVKVARTIHLVSFFEMKMTPIAPFIKRIASALNCHWFFNQLTWLIDRGAPFCNIEPSRWNNHRSICRSS